MSLMETYFYNYIFLINSKSEICVYKVFTDI